MSAPPTDILESVRWPATTDPPTEVEILWKIQILRSHKAPGSDSLSPALSEDGETALVREFQVCSGRFGIVGKYPPFGELIVVRIIGKSLHGDCANYRGSSLFPMASMLL